WPLWEDGGIRVDPATLAVLRSQGLDAMSTAHGIYALYRAWRTEASHVTVLSGNRQQIRRWMAPSTPAPANLQPVAATARAGDAAQDRMSVGSGELQEKTIAYLKRVLAGTLKLPTSRIEADARF